MSNRLETSHSINSTVSQDKEETQNHQNQNENNPETPVRKKNITAINKRNLKRTIKQSVLEDQDEAKFENTKKSKSSSEQLKNSKP